MKKIRTIIIGLFIIIPLAGNAIVPSILQTCIKLQLTNKIIDDSESMGEVHRTPPRIPTVYFDASASTVYFENPCYECTLELVIPGTDTVAYTYSIPDGDDTVQLPTNISGTYELHIHRGNYCFFGEIEL